MKYLYSSPAVQQPRWEDPDVVMGVREHLAAQPGLVSASEVQTLRSMLGYVAGGHAHIIQAGDCAEDPAESTVGDVARKAGLLDVLAGTMKMNAHKPVLRSGRIAGQFAKPRSNSFEMDAGRELPVYRGAMVNRPERDPEARKSDPYRLLSGYNAARDEMNYLGWGGSGPGAALESPVWTSHEALLLDYEVPMLRRAESGDLVLTSTHWPWIGDRTRQLDGAHVTMLAEVVNPVACKVGPTMTVDELLALCRKLDPNRDSGRLTLIARFGAESIADKLPPLVTAVRRAGHPVTWLTDPMHGNTVTTPDGFKTRFLNTITREISDFQYVVRDSGGIAGGIHLETTPENVTECVSEASDVGRVGDKYTTLCDPRLSPEQAITAVSVWTR